MIIGGMEMVDFDHMTLKNNPNVETEAEGDEPERRVIIIPRNC